MEFDAKCKKFSFIEKTTQLRESFSFAHPTEVIHAMKIYCCDHYGSMLWDLGGKMAGQVFRVWNTAVKLAWGLPRQCHSYFLEMLSGGITSAQCDIFTRYAGFVKKLRSSSNYEVRILFNIVSRDIRSTTGRNIKLVSDQCGRLDLILSSSKEMNDNTLVSTEIPPEDAWRIPYLAKLLTQRQESYYDGQSSEFLTLMIDSLCSN